MQACMLISINFNPSLQEWVHGAPSHFPNKMPYIQWFFNRPFSPWICPYPPPPSFHPSQLYLNGSACSHIYLVWVHPYMYNIVWLGLTHWMGIAHYFWWVLRGACPVGSAVDKWLIRRSAVDDVTGVFDCFTIACGIALTWGWQEMILLC